MDKAALILTHAHMDHVRYAEAFAKSGVLKKPGFIGYKKDPYVHCYSSGKSVLYVDCGDGPPRKIWDKDKNIQTFSKPVFSKHMQIDKVLMSEATARWLEIEAKHLPYFSFKDIPNKTVLKNSVEAKFNNYHIKFFPSSHAFGAVFPFFNDTKRNFSAAHLVDADNGEFYNLARGIKKRGLKSELVKQVLKSDFVCLDCSHVFENYPDDKSAQRQYTAGLFAFKKGQYNRLIFSFHSPLNTFKYLLGLGKHFKKEDRKDMNLIFTNPLTHELFEAFTMQGEYKGDSRFEGLVPKPILDNFKSFNYGFVKSFKIPDRSLVFCSNYRISKRLKKMKDTFRVSTKYHSPQRGKNFTDLIVKNHPDQKEVLNLMRHLIKHGKDGQTIIMNSVADYTVEKINKLDRFQAIQNFAKKHGKHIHAVTRPYWSQLV